ncbi:MAG: DUF1993 domain-containing protein [Steroidobacteraceae bacterium]
MYSASVGVYSRVLTNLDAILDKAVAWADERKLDHAALLQARLAPDMFPLIRQVQIASDMIKGTVSRLAGVEPPRFEDTEQSFADLKVRIAKTLGFIRSVAEAQFEGSEDRTVLLQMRTRKLEFKGLAYLQDFGTPNVYFHYSMVYALLRHNGLAIGKADFTGA